MHKELKAGPGVLTVYSKYSQKHGPQRIWWGALQGGSHQVRKAANKVYFFA